MPISTVGKRLAAPQDSPPIFLLLLRLVVWVGLFLVAPFQTALANHGSFVLEALVGQPVPGRMDRYFSSVDLPVTNASGDLFFRGSDQHPAESGTWHTAFFLRRDGVSRLVLSDQDSIVQRLGPLHNVRLGLDEAGRAVVAFNRGILRLPHVARFLNELLSQLPWERDVIVELSSPLPVAALALRQEQTRLSFLPPHP